MRNVLRSVILDLRFVSAGLALFLIPVDVGHGQIPWRYNTLCDWTTTTLLAILCGQTLAVCVARPCATRWWIAFGTILILYLTDVLFTVFLLSTSLVGTFFFSHLMGTSSGILHLLFLFTLAVFISYHFVLVLAVRASLPGWERLLRMFGGLSLGFVSLLFCIHFASDYTQLPGGADTVLFIGARALIPYFFWSCIKYPSRPLSSYFIRAPKR